MMLLRAILIHLMRSDFGACSPSRRRMAAIPAQQIDPDFASGRIYPSRKSSTNDRCLREGDGRCRREAGISDCGSGVGVAGMAGALLHLEIRTTGCMHQVRREWRRFALL